MKIVGTMAMPGCRRRTYRPAFKREVAQACRQQGVSVAGIALIHGINVNVVHRWLREAAQLPRALPSPAFVPVALDPPLAHKAMAGAPSGAKIRIEVQRGESRIVVSWPLGGAARVCCLAPAVGMIRIDALWLATAPLDMRGPARTRPWPAWCTSLAPPSRTT